MCKLTFKNLNIRKKGWVAMFNTYIQLESIIFSKSSRLSLQVAKLSSIRELHICQIWLARLVYSATEFYCQSYLTTGSPS